MAVPQPNIVPSLDQIGLASLEIPFSIVDSDFEKKTFSAFAVQKFGKAGVPQKRISLYAFNGKIEDDYFQMDCRNCEFEITSFTIPLDLFRISGFLRTDGTVARGSNMLIEKDWGGRFFNLMKDMSKNSPISVKMLTNHLKSVGFVQFFKASKSFFPALIRQLVRGTWQSWGLLNQNNKLTGIGTFRLNPIPNDNETVEKKVQVIKFEMDQEKMQIVTEVRLPENTNEWDIALSILLIEKTTGSVIPINYTTQLKYEKLGSRKNRVLLSIPKTICKRFREFKAYLMADIYPILEKEFKINEKK